MRPLPRFALLPCAAAALACASAPPAVPFPMPTSGAASGGVIFVPLGSAGTGATFDESRVVGPTVNMAAMAEGGWGGDLVGRNLVLQIEDGRLGGAAFELLVEQEGDAVHLAGVRDGRRVNLRLSSKRLQGTLDGGGCSFDLSMAAPGWYRGFVSCQPPPGRKPVGPLSAAGRMPVVTPASLRLSGDANRFDHPVLPQLALALLAVLPP